MIEAPPLLRIKSPMRRPTRAQTEAFDGVPTGFVVDALFGGGALSLDIQAVGQVSGGPVCGPAVTADCGPADVLATFAALKYLEPGDMLVAGFDGHQGCAAAGDRLVGMVKNCGAAGFVTDGPVRDIDGIDAVGLPVWCSGTTPASPHMSGPGRVGHPVQIGGQEVETGDMIVGDRDGVVVVPFERIDEVIGRLDRIAELEAKLDAEVAAGLTVPGWVEEMLAGDQVVVED